MSKPNPLPASNTTSGDTPAGRTHRGPAQDASRETLESIAFAFVLALLFRTFVAEAFVIPTGSMAPTLFGRNKDVVCSECHYYYQVGASDEVNDEGYLLRRIDDSVCPNCRHLNDIHNLPVFKGDRILVNKFPYQIGDPHRWDVIVFRYPEDPQKNYIKRLVGLPGEALHIARGDVYARSGDSSEFKILRKANPNKQKVLQQLVYDDSYPPSDLLAKGWPERWNPMSRSGNSAADESWSLEEKSWKRDAKARSFAIEPSSERKWIRYQHLLPHKDDWSDAVQGIDLAANAKPQLITDFCGYNAYRVRERDGFHRNMFAGGYHGREEDSSFWVGDLTLNCVVEITAVKGDHPELILELVEGVRRYQCRIDVATGQARLVRNEEMSAHSETPEIEMATAATPVRGPGRYTLTFANVDDRLCLWVNSTWLSSGLIPFGSGSEYLPPANTDPQQADLAPAGVASRDLGVQVSNLLLQRDIYYRADHENGGPSGELPGSVSLQHAVFDPAEYADLYKRHAINVTFRELGPDEFFVLGDNSPRSQDSRLWSNYRQAVNRHAVPRSALLGKAFFIYWPHGIPFLNNGKGFTILNHSLMRGADPNQPAEAYPEYEFPFYPQWWRWKRIQ